MQVSSQEDLPAEESIYVRFSPNKDQALFPNGMQRIGLKNLLC